MRGNPFHPWNVRADEARQIQLWLARLVISDDDWTSLNWIGGISIRPFDESTVQVAVSVLDLATMKTIDSAVATAKSDFPYISGLRAFQAGPAILSAFAQLRTRPDLLLWSGHGVAHPRKCGLASHLGILLDTPSVGISEELLYGTCNGKALSQERGSSIIVFDPTNDTEIGAAVRTRSGVRPIYVSVGHRVSLESAVRIVLDCTTRYRIPEPLREARSLCKCASR